MRLAWLIPRPDESGSDLLRRTQVLLTVSLVGANLVGAAIVYAIASWVFPYPEVDEPGATPASCRPASTAWSRPKRSWIRSRSRNPGHVGEDVARAALDQGIELGRERRDVAVLFTDVIGSAELAGQRPPEEVVELLNSFFGLVVDVVDEHGGWVNKFEGDAALAVFGAPIPLEQASSGALAAARELADRLPREVEGLEAAIGVSAGEVVAGNVGDERRFEYTVIGDPVNEAARMTELAKERSPHVLASDSILERASEPESERWRLDGTVTLRGRSAQTRLAEPVLDD
jgi:class 3 adenylate cyclase